MSIRPLWFTLLLLPCLPVIHAQAPAKADLEGDVVNSTSGAPIAGARIKLEPSQDEPIFARADVNGHFRFADLDPGTYRLSARSPGFLNSGPAFVNLTAPRQGGLGGGIREVAYPAARLPAATITKSTGPDGVQHAKATVPLLAGAVIAGRVTDPFGVPLAETTVEVLAKDLSARDGSASPIGHQEQVRTNDKGEFRVVHLVPGTYYLVVNKSGLAQWESSYRITYYGGATDLGAAKPLVVAPGEQVRADLQIVRQAGVRVAGRLIKPPGVDLSAGSMVYTNVTLVPAQNRLLNPNGPFTTGREDYRFNDVLPGKYVLMALSADASTDPFGGNQKPLFGLIRQIEVGDRDMDDFDLALQPLRDIAGTVIFQEGCRPAPMHISAYSNSPLGRRPPEATSGADGKFVLRGLSTARYTLSIYLESSRGVSVPVVSIQQGDRNVLKDGLESPFTGDEPLLVTVGCRNLGRPR
jgi:hypothetical protein